MPLPTDLALFHPGAQTPSPPANFVSNTHFHVHTYTSFQHLHFPQHAHSKLFLNLEEAQVTHTLAPTDCSQGSLKNCQADSSSLRPRLGSSAPTMIIRLHFQQSRSPLSGAAPAKSSPELRASSFICQHPRPVWME